MSSPEIHSEPSARELPKKSTSLSGSLLGGALPGALAGTQVAGLLFFLNPHLPFGPLPVLSGVVFYGLLLGGASLLLSLP